MGLEPYRALVPGNIQAESDTSPPEPSHQALKAMHLDEPMSPDRRSRSTLVNVPSTSSTTTTLADEMAGQAESKHKTQPSMIPAPQPESEPSGHQRPLPYPLGTVMSPAYRLPISSTDGYDFNVQIYTAILRTHQEITEDGLSFTDDISPDLAIDTGSNVT
ncbi:hypothetical protein C8Q78DRAFT_752343 [Trametes maxima]|nr:hypothetical protein C8Q78DRAFT_752343 [Trametes maxima]